MRKEKFKDVTTDLWNNNIGITTDDISPQKIFIARQEQLLTELKLRQQF